MAAKDLNHIVIIGRLVRDPEIKYTPSGVALAKFSIANNESFMQNNERKEYVNYFDVNVWGNQAVNCEKYLRKGSQVAIEGQLRQSRWADQASGQTRSKVDITASSVQFLTPVTGGAPGAGAVSGGYQQQQQPQYQQQMPRQQAPVQHEGNGFIEDPWGDSGQSDSGGYSDPYAQQNNDDDIPF